MSSQPSSPDPACARVLIAGGGVADLETLSALRALASDLLDITILAPELKGINLSMSIDQPFKSSGSAAPGSRTPPPSSARAGTSALWWPPGKAARRYLAPYLPSQVGDALDVMPQGEHAIPIDPGSADIKRCFGELPDLPSR